MSFGKTRTFALLAALFVGFTLVSTDFADARRGGSFGSRGSRTFQSAPATRTAPTQTGPVERTMTPNTGTPNTGTNSATRQQQTVGQQRPGFFNGMGGSLMRGLVLGGLLGVLLGYGFGGMAGALGFIIQLLAVAIIASLVMGYLRSRRSPATAGGPQTGTAGSGFSRDGYNRETSQPSQPGGRAGSFTLPSFGSGSTAAVPSQDISLDQADLDIFEQRLAQVQEAFANEDHAALRRLSTPEMVSFFSEELAENAKNGMRNDVRDVRLVQADIAEAWREGDQDYATAAFQYESIDVMRDRKTDRVVEGDETPSETTELWTFVRRKGDDWKLSAIQETA